VTFPAIRSSRSAATHALVLADNTWNGSVQGINQIQAKETAKYGPGNYKPILWVTYWTFRIMVGCGIVMFCLMAVGLWLMRKRRLERTTWFLRLSVFAIVLPFLAIPPAGSSPRWVPAMGGLRFAQDLAGGLHRRHGVRRGHIGRVHRHLQPPGCRRFRIDGKFARFGADDVDEHDAPNDPVDPDSDTTRVPALIY